MMAEQMPERIWAHSSTTEAASGVWRNHDIGPAGTEYRLLSPGMVVVSEERLRELIPSSTCPGSTMHYPSWSSPVRDCKECRLGEPVLPCWLAYLTSPAVADGEQVQP